MLPVANISEYDDLISENKNNPHIRKFSTNEDVIELAESGAEGQKALCFESYANQRNEFISATIPLGYGMQLIIEMKSKYFAAGIFFNLKTFTSTFAQGLTWNDLSVLINGLRILGLQQEWQYVVVGAVILLAVYGDNLLCLS